MPKEPRNEPVGEQVTRELDHAIDCLSEDIDRVEMWSVALRAWLEPIPDYGSVQHEFLLPRATDGGDGGRPI